MADASKAREAARKFFEDYRTNRIYEPLADSVAPGTVNDAYGVQEEFLKLLSQLHGLLAYTTPSMQQRASTVMN